MSISVIVTGDTQRNKTKKIFSLSGVCILQWETNKKLSIQTTDLIANCDVLGKAG